MIPMLIAGRVILKRFREGAAADARQHVRAQNNRPAVNRSNRPKRYATDAASTKRSGQFTSDAGWTPIYRFNYIFLATSISRIKILQTAAIILSTPILIIMYKQKKVSGTSVSLVIGGAVFALIMLIVMSSFMRHLIGVVSLDRNRRSVRFGYMTFWGNRRDIVVPVDDIVPFTELTTFNPTKSQPYVKLQRYTDDRFKLYLPLMCVTVVDKALFHFVFGDFTTKKQQ